MTTRDCWCPICAEPEAYGRNVRNARYHDQWRVAKPGPERWAVEQRIMSRRREAIDDAEIPAVIERAERWVVPRLGATHAGVSERKPGDYPVTATFAHIGTPEMAAAVVTLLRLQTARPYIIIVDTGSAAADVRKIENLRGHDCEIHYLKGHGYGHSSDPVALACDLALLHCQTAHLFFTHADCFLTNRELLECWASRCDAANPVIGYGMTDRSRREIARLTNRQPDEIGSHEWTDDWPWMVGHTALMTHAPTMRSRGIWFDRRIGSQTGMVPFDRDFWDTEYSFNWHLRRKGITPERVAGESNFARNRDENIDHVRSMGVKAIYDHAGGGDHQWRAKREEWLSEALAEARARAVEWARGGESPATPAMQALTPARIEQLRRCKHRRPFAGCSCSQHCSLKGHVVSMPMTCDSCPDYAIA